MGCPFTSLSLPALLFLSFPSGSPTPKFSYGSEGMLWLLQLNCQLWCILSWKSCLWWYKIINWWLICVTTQLEFSSESSIRKLLIICLNLGWLDMKTPRGSPPTMQCKRLINKYTGQCNASSTVDFSIRRHRNASENDFRKTGVASSTVIVRSSSRLSDVTPRLRIPQGTMASNHRSSVQQLSARPCVVTKWPVWIPTSKTECTTIHHQLHTFQTRGCPTMLCYVELDEANSPDDTV